MKIALPTMTSGLRARLERRVGTVTCSGCRAARGLRGVMRWSIAAAPWRARLAGWRIGARQWHSVPSRLRCSAADDGQGCDAVGLQRRTRHRRVDGRARPCRGCVSSTAAPRGDRRGRSVGLTAAAHCRASGWPRAPLSGFDLERLAFLRSAVGVSDDLGSGSRGGLGDLG